MTITARPERAAFRISGPDATRLLHDVLTTTVAPEGGLGRWFALLSPQGKILAEGLVGWAADAYWLDVHEGVVDTFEKRMRMYRLRARMEIENLKDTHRVGWSPDAPQAGLVHADSRLDGLGVRVLAEASDAASWGPGDGQAAARIAHGIAELGPDFDPDDLFPHDIGMDHLGGVDFKKGCFVGQEVVSRMQHRGTARRRPVIATGLPAAARGDAVTVEGRNAGTIGTPRAGAAVAVVRIDKVRDPGAARIADAPVRLALPPWARYGFADSAAAG